MERDVRNVRSDERGDGQYPRRLPVDLPAPTLGALLHIAIPSAAFTVLTNGYRVVDQYFVQSISVPAQAAVGSSIFVIIVLFGAFELLSAGAGPLIARATGAGDARGRRRILGQALTGALVLTGIIMAVGGLGSGLIARSMGLEGQTAVEFERYFVALSLTSLPLVLTPLVDQAFLGMGNARAPMILHAVSLALNLVLTPLLIGAGLGIVGAALASNIARAVATAAGLILLKRDTGLVGSDLRIDGELLRVLRIGLPMAANTLAYALVYWAMLKTSISPLGPHVNAALGIGFSALEGFTWPVFHGLSLGVASLVGRLLGAGEKARAKAVVRTAFPVSTLLGVLASLAFWLAGAELTDIFTDDPVVHAEATRYAVILAASQLPVAWEALAEGVLAGSGDTRAVLWWSAPFNLLRVPLAWWLAFPLGFGAAGIWWAINLTTYLKTLGKGWETVRGRWADLET